MNNNIIWLQRKNIFIFVSIFLFTLFFINGLYSFTSSSEFWSISVAKYFFSLDSKWSSVYFKPLFNLILSFFYILPLNDLNHIQIIKFVFTVNGLIQIGLLFKILQTIKKNSILSILVSFCIYSSPFLISHYDRIRSDQFALTLFLFLIYLDRIEFKHRNSISLALLVLFPFVAFKHIYFSALTLFFIPVKARIESFKNLSLIRKFIYSLVVLNIAVWTLFFATKALPYFLSSFNHFLNDLDRITYILKQEWLLLGLSYFSLLIPEFRNYLKNNNLFSLALIQLPILIILFIHPQKFNFFIASFLPLIFILAALFVLFLTEKKYKYQKHFNFILYFSLIANLIYNLYLPTQAHRFLNLKNPQFETIRLISSILEKHNLTYLDGMGLFPRQKLIGCFVSPDDDVANKSCIDSIQNQVSETILVTNRLMGLEFDFNHLEEMGYMALGPNFYLRRDISNQLKLEKQTWPIPSLIFTTEQLY